MKKFSSKTVNYTIFLFILFWFSHAYTQALVEADWLDGKTCIKNLVVLEVHRGKKNYELEHIPCSVYTNFYENDWRQTIGKTVLSLPSIEVLTKVVEKHGISNKDHVVIASPGTGEYDAAEAAAIYYTFKYLGHGNVSILNGGIPAWMEDWNRDTETGFKDPVRGTFTPEIEDSILANKDDVLYFINHKKQLLDARPSDMYLGINNLMPSVRQGTIPGAINVPNRWLLRNGTLYFNTKDNLKTIFDYLGIKLDEPQISFCNAGLESALLWFVISEVLEYSDSKLYEASLAEWSRDDNLPMAKILAIEFNNRDAEEDDSYSMKPN